MDDTGAHQIRRLADGAIEAITGQTARLDPGMRWAAHAEIARRLLAALMVERDRPLAPAEADRLAATVQWLSERARILSAQAQATARRRDHPPD